ncbi:MAG: DUF4442 domain-containing protein [Neisseria sp.]|nr:DUF4442 domain-containing protein [Neisseria sp.]
MRIENKMYRQITSLNRFPAAVRLPLATFMMGKFVPFLRTAGTRFDKLTREEVKVSVDNKRRVQNHIGGVHACVMALLAETASGFVFGMNTPDDKLMLLKSMQMNYVKRSVGNMYAVASLSEQDAELIQREERGNIIVPVKIYDESDEPPVEAEMTWAWVLKKPQA